MPLILLYLNMPYHIIFDKEDYNELVDSYLKQGFNWINGEFIPKYLHEFPLVLNCDDEKTMMVAVIKYFKDAYFSDSEFMKLYTVALREKKLQKRRKKLERILK